jgi:hypothetical protein
MIIEASFNICGRDGKDKSGIRCRPHFILEV